MTTEKLRIGLLIDSMAQPAWVVEMMRQIQEEGCASVSLCVINASPSERAHKPLWRKLANNWGVLIYAVFRRLDAYIFDHQLTALDAGDIAPFLKNAEVMTVKPKQSRFSDMLEAEDVAAIRQHNLDVLIRLGFRILKGDVLDAARHGVWSLHHGDNRVNRGVPPGFWEVLESWPTTGAVLQRLTAELDGGVVISRSTSTTLRPAVVGNLENYYWKSARMIPRALKLLRELGTDNFTAMIQSQNVHPAFYSREIYKIPRNLRMLKLLTRHVYWYVRTRARNVFFKYQWTLMFAFQAGTRLPENVSRYRKIRPPKDRIWADPHIFRKNETTFVFFEELEFRGNKGVICVLEIDAKGKVSEPTKVLECPYHLSYPFVFEHEDKIYMIPETMDNGTIELYEATDFPHRWKHVMNLMDGVRAVDATVLFRDGLWWLFANLSEHPKIPTTDELFLFSAKEFPTNQWTPHVLNPVVSSATSSRPAGRFFERDGHLYRPSQDCSQHYGRALNINLVEELSTTEYRETTVSRIEPLWAPEVRGVHTLSVDDHITVIDAEVRRSRF